jgi:hypothetical protein
MQFIAPLDSRALNLLTNITRFPQYDQQSANPYKSHQNAKLVLIQIHKLCYSNFRIIYL